MPEFLYEIIKKVILRWPFSSNIFLKHLILTLRKHSLSVMELLRKVFGKIVSRGCEPSQQKPKTPVTFT